MEYIVKVMETSTVERIVHRRSPELSSTIFFSSKPYIASSCHGFPSFFRMHSFLLSLAGRTSSQKALSGVLSPPFSSFPLSALLRRPEGRRFSLSPVFSRSFLFLFLFLHLFLFASFSSLLFWFFLRTTEGQRRSPDPLDPWLDLEAD